jgi:hypothetical protein
MKASFGGDATTHFSLNYPPGSVVMLTQLHPGSVMMLTQLCDGVFLKQFYIRNVKVRILQSTNIRPVRLI